MHLVSELFANSRSPHSLFIFNEPSKGLSQNILNQFIDSIRGILKDESVSIMMIEHNGYMMESSDYIIDFGKRTNEPFTHLDVLHHNEYYKTKNRKDIALPSSISSTLKLQNGIRYIKANQIDYRTLKISIKGAF